MPTEAEYTPMSTPDDVVTRTMSEPAPPVHVDDLTDHQLTTSPDLGSSLRWRADCLRYGATRSVLSIRLTRV